MHCCHGEDDLFPMPLYIFKTHTLSLTLSLVYSPPQNLSFPSPPPPPSLSFLCVCVFPPSLSHAPTPLHSLFPLVKLDPVSYFLFFENQPLKDQLPKHMHTHTHTH